MLAEDPQENYGAGWIRLYRSVTNHWLWIEKPFSKFEAWIWLLLHANHTSKRINLGFELFDVERGQFISSQEKLSENFGWSRNQVRSFLDLLQNDKMVTIDTTTKFTKITICNYDTYQSNLPTNIQPNDNDLTTTLQPTGTTNTLNNYNNVKNYKKEEFFEIIFPFESEIFKTTWSTWKKFRSEIKKPYKSKLSEQAGLKMLSKFDEQTAIKMIEQSIANSWQGIFELKNNYNGKQKGKFTDEELATSLLARYGTSGFKSND